MNRKHTRTLKSFFLLLASLLFYFYPEAAAQTNPYPFALRGGDYTFTGLATGVEVYPASMQGWSGPHLLLQSSSPVSVQADGDEPLRLITPNLQSEISNHGSSGICVERRGQNDNPGRPFALAISVNTIGCTGISISWNGDWSTEAVGSECFLQLQYRVGTSGSWTDVPNHLITPPAFLTFGPTLLPAAIENKPVVQLRWVYYCNTLTDGDGILVDEVTITAATKSSLPVAAFTWTQNTDVQVQFMNDSKNTPTTWTWYFGDDSTSTLENPVHTYADTGWYNVRLVVSNATGVDSIIKPIHVQPMPAVPEADFSYTAPALEATFTDLSKNMPESWEWDFGDGNTSTDQNPVYEYPFSGTYNVQLIATNALGSNTVLKSVTVPLVTGLEKETENTLRVWPNPSAGFVMLDLGMQPGTVSVYNSLGSLIQAFNGITGLNRIDLAGLPAGLYAIDVQAKGSSRSINVQKE